MAHDPHDPHVIKKQRDGGTRHGEVTYYAVGWQRSTRSEAREDLRRFLGAREWEAALRAEIQEEVGSLQAQLHRALGGGAELLEAMETFLDDTSDRHWPEQYERLRTALAASPLAKLAGEVTKEALAVDWDAVLAGNATGLKGLVWAADALRAELQKGGEGG